MLGVAFSRWHVGSDSDAARFLADAQWNETMLATPERRQQQRDQDDGATARRCEREPGDTVMCLDGRCGQPGGY